MMLLNIAYYVDVDQRRRPSDLLARANKSESEIERDGERYRDVARDRARERKRGSEGERDRERE